MGADYSQVSPVGPGLRPEWSAHLVMDVALNSSVDSICEVHELQQHTLHQICESPVFASQVAAVRKQLEKEGATFKMKAQLQADFYLQQVHEMIMDKEMDPRVRTRLIENVARWAGLDAPQAVGSHGALGGFSISINFDASTQRRGVTIDGNQA